MPLIGPPPSEPEKREEPVDIPATSQSEYDRIQRFLDVPNWRCAVCKAVNFGRNKKCAFCFGRLNRITPRPDDYIEPPL